MITPRIVIITGLSGSGKSTALKALEDIGFYCVDNLPPMLVQKFIELCIQSNCEISKIALLIDIREREFLKEIPATIESLKREGYPTEILFLEASDEDLIKRYSETRRPHPLSGHESPLSAIQKERIMMKPLREKADRVIDTTSLNVHQLKSLIQSLYSKWSPSKIIRLNIVSFGYKYGIPLEADLVFDVRFLPNPYFIEELKAASGQDQRVADYILRWRETRTFINKIKDLLDFLLPLYEKEGKSYITIAFGCTGGKHRSVVIANEVGRLINPERFKINVIHRDIDKE